MKKAIIMSLEEFSELCNKTFDWNNLEIGTIYPEKNQFNKWEAIEVTGRRKTYDGFAYDLVEYPLIISNS